MANTACLAPEEVGTNVVVAVQVAPAAKLVPQVLVCLNSVASPLTAKGNTARAEAAAL